MRILKNCIYASTFAILVASCSSNSEKATEVVKSFASAVTAQDSTATVKVYPKSKDFYSKLPKVSGFEVKSVDERDNSFIVSATCSYYDESNTFKQRDLTFWTKKDGSDFIIYDSKGLLSLPEGLDKYAYKKGILSPTSTDVSISSKIGEVGKEFYKALLSNLEKLNNGIEKLSWSWEADYGTPNGRVTIKNTLPFAVKNVKYKITFYGYDDETVVGNDDGTVSYDEIEPGEMKSFTFYSSGVNGYAAQRANIRFEVPEKYAYEWTISDAN